MDNIAPARRRENLGRRWLRRSTILILGALSAGVAALFSVNPAQAHPLSSSAILLTINSDQVTGQIQLPIDRLAIAIDQPLTAAVVQEPAKAQELHNYVLAHLAVDNTDTGGADWNITLGGGRVEVIDGVDHLVYDTAIEPPKGEVTDFQLHFDGIVHHLLSHKVFVSSRESSDAAYDAVGLIDWRTQTVEVPVQGQSLPRVFVSSVHLGVEHIAEGADHLLFLVMLLLPAPLLAIRGRWVRTSSVRRSCIRVVQVVTAFAVGHSITLALAAFGYLQIPSRVVESLIALSILVSGIHAIRPIVRGGEVWIAGCFGLVHGIAFATLLNDLHTSGSSLITELFGFNLGIELTQLIVVALLMPSLLLLSRTRVYTPLRVLLAGLGIVLSTGWLLERTTMIHTDPFAPISDAAVTHPFWIAGALAVIAVAIWATPALRLPSPPGPAPDVKDDNKVSAQTSTDTTR
ncbi:HupE/UreJ family protein [Rhodococcus sp. IEGM 1409]|uniref:HupE/UreJ family protein n=1 Tax=Rhodococcus sp. IEGM 1409 TaxID=3047082 RepID=UPI0024B7C8BC|nr:HupE/UreJ family protein [Rhodococcus sp. IEGM 1409]MDI9903710.1 HupE/UreJ family protein [Rhodococcus sp. IEGM 1409]